MNNDKIYSSLREYSDILEAAIKRELKIIVPNYPMTFSVVDRIQFLERILVINGKHLVEKRLWEMYGEKLCRPYYNALKIEAGK